MLELASGTTTRKRLIFGLGLVCLLAVLLAPGSPRFTVIPNRDSGVFLYIGDQILRGKIPYLDVWDHKPPLIYYINVLAVILGRRSLWGLWVVELVSLWLAAALGFVTTRRAFGTPVSVFASISWLLTFSLLFSLEGGNRVEEFALPFQFAALYIFTRREIKTHAFGQALFIGVTAGLSFLLRPNSIGVQAGVTLFLLAEGLLRSRWRTALASVGGVVVGASGVVGIAFAYFAANGALGELFDQLVTYNLVYSAASTGDRINSVLNGLLITSFSGASLLAIAGWLAAIVVLLRRQPINGKFKPLISVAVIGLPIEFALSAISGRGYNHYYISWLPMFSVLTGFFAYALLPGLASALQSVLQGKPSARNVVSIVALLIAMSAFPVWGAMSRMTAVDPRSEVVQMVETATRGEDKVLFWGAEAEFNYLTQRQAPTRFVYQYPLYTRDYVDRKMTKQFLADLDQKRPVLIIDTSPTNDLVPPLKAQPRQDWNPQGPEGQTYGLIPEMDEVFAYVDANYRLARTVGPMQWPVYERK